MTGDDVNCELSTVSLDQQKNIPNHSLAEQPRRIPSALEYFLKIHSTYQTCDFTLNNFLPAWTTLVGSQQHVL